MFDELTALFEYSKGCPKVVDVRALLLIVPASMLVMKAYLEDNRELCIAWIIVGILSYLWMQARLNHAPIYGRDAEKLMVYREPQETAAIL